MRVLVTGADGLIGRYASRFYQEAGWDVVGVDLKRGSDALDLFRREDTRYDRVIHAAYVVGGREMIDGVNDAFAQNQELDAAMIRWAIRTKQRRIVYFSSSAAYPVSEQTKWCAESYEDVRLHEDDIDLSKDLGMPDADYGWSKLSGERLAAAARRNNVPVTVLRPFSGYWHDQDETYPFPAILRRASTGDLSVWGPVGQCRDWIAIPDIIAGMHAVVDSGTELPVNLCTGVATEMGDLAKMIAIEACVKHSFQNPAVSECVHKCLEDPTYLEDKPTGVFYRVGDPTRFHQYYTPKVSLEEGVRRALA